MKDVHVVAWMFLVNMYTLKLLLVSVLLIINVAFNAHTDCGPIDIQQDNISRTEQIRCAVFTDLNAEYLQGDHRSPFGQFLARISLKRKFPWVHSFKLETSGREGIIAWGNLSSIHVKSSTSCRFMANLCQMCLTRLIWGLQSLFWCWINKKRNLQIAFYFRAFLFGEWGAFVCDDSLSPHLSGSLSSLIIKFKGCVELGGVRGGLHWDQSKGSLESLKLCVVDK